MQNHLQKRIIETIKDLIFFNKVDIPIFVTILRGEFNISDFQNKTLRKHLTDFNSGKVSSLLKRLRTHGLIKKVGKTYKYYLKKLGKETIITN